MEKINIAELLKDCPTGMELDCTVSNDAYLEKVYENVTYPIAIRIGKTNTIRLTKEGYLYSYSNPKCIIFPKGQTTWEGFVPPCKFKDGDIVYIKTKGYYHNEFIIIFKEIKNDHIHKHVCFAYQELYISKNAVCHLVDVEIMRLATEEEKQKLFDAIRVKGYEWHAETKTLEKLIKQKFKVGDRIKYRSGEIVYRIVQITEDSYVLDNLCSIPISIEHMYNLVPTKFDINTLVPFEDKVLVRNDESQRWLPAFWGYKVVDGFITTFGWCKYCIPYKGNENLFKTNNDCDDFYKTWEK